MVPADHTDESQGVPETAWLDVTGAGAALREWIAESSKKIAAAEKLRPVDAALIPAQELPNLLRKSLVDALAAEPCFL